MEVLVHFFLGIWLTISSFFFPADAKVFETPAARPASTTAVASSTPLQQVAPSTASTSSESEKGPAFTLTTGSAPGNPIRGFVILKPVSGRLDCTEYTVTRNETVESGRRTETLRNITSGISKTGACSFFGTIYSCEQPTRIEVTRSGAIEATKELSTDACRKFIE